MAAYKNLAATECSEVKISVRLYEILLISRERCKIEPQLQ